MKRIVKNVRYLFRTFVLGKSDFGLWVLACLPRFKNKVVSSRTEVCVEGFPRSANSFFVAYVRFFNPGVYVADHVHVPAQVFRAVQRGIPCVVLIRNPLDAIASLLVIDRSLLTELAIQSYIDFYEKLLKVEDRVVVAEFEQVITNPEKIIQMLNSKYGCEMKHGQLTEGMKKEIFSRLHAHHAKEKQRKHLIPIPTLEKKMLQVELKAELSGHPLFERAQNIYNLYRFRTE